MTRDEAKHELYLKVVNASSTPRQLQIELLGEDHPTGTATLTRLSGHTMEATNSLTDPTQIVPHESVITGISSSFQRTFPAYSIEVMDISLRGKDK